MIWNEIISELKNVSTKIFESINPGLNHKQISKFENEINLTLPNSFKEYLSVMNGQNYNREVLMFGYQCFMPIDEIIEDWKMMNESFGSEKPIEFLKENSVKPLYWSDKWIPFANYEASNRVVLDFYPGKYGQYGQIVHHYPGADLESNENILSSSFEHFSKRVLNTLKTKNYVIENDVIVIDWL